MKIHRKLGVGLDTLLSTKSSVIYLVVGIFLIILVLAFWIFRQWNDSFFAKPYQRVNIGMWGKRSMILSYNLGAPDHTLIIFANNYEIEIPGGLSGYNIGSLGKLVDLEKKPLIFKKALSSAGQLLIHKVQHENTSNVYFSDHGDISNDEVVRSMITEMMFAPGELNIFERAYLLYNMSNIVSTRTERMMVVSQKPEVKFFERTFRNEREVVQIQYQKSVKTAYELAQMLENIGIRVSDVVSTASGGENKVSAECEIIEPGESFSQTSEFLASYFSCSKRHGDTGLYNIKLILGDRVETEWGG